MEHQHAINIISRSLVDDDDPENDNGAAPIIPPPLNIPRVRVWELNENSTHYDKLVAAPPQEDVIKMWAGWAGISLITGVLITCIFLPLVVSPKPIRKNPFNLYLIFLLVPDMLFGWFCGGTCLANALTHHYTSVTACHFQSFYVIASFCANSNLNALVARQLYNMLKASHRFRRYKPPTHQQVILEAMGVYLYSTCLALLAVLPTSWRIPHQTRLINGTACVPMNYDTASTIFFYCIFFPILFGLPFGYVCYAAFQIWKQRLLPKSGRRRVLTIYFFRLAAVFVIMWIPGLLLIFVLGGSVNPWIQWIGGSWSHLQGAVSALVSLLKPDIWKTVRNFWLGNCCCCCGGVDMLTSSSSTTSQSQRRRQQESSSSGAPWTTSFTSGNSIRSLSNRSLSSHGSRRTRDHHHHDHHRWPVFNNKTGGRGGGASSSSIWNLLLTSKAQRERQAIEQEINKIAQEVNNNNNKLMLEQGNNYPQTYPRCLSNLEEGKNSITNDNDNDDEQRRPSSLPETEAEKVVINEAEYDEDEISALGSRDDDDDDLKEGVDEEDDQGSFALVSAGGGSLSGHNDDPNKAYFTRSLNLERNFSDMVIAFEEQRKSQSMPKLLLQFETGDE